MTVARYSQDVGDVAYPGGRRAVHGELTIKQIVGHGVRMPTVGGAGLEAASGLATQSFLTHQPGHALVAHPMVTGTQRLHHARATVGAAATGVNRVQVCTPRRVWIWASRTLQVLMEAGDRHLQRAAQLPDRIASPFTRDDGVPHLDSLAKNAVAFFKMSRSIFSVAFSARNRASSLCSSSTGLRLGALSARRVEPIAKCLDRHIQLPGRFSWPERLGQQDRLSLEIVCVATTR